MDPCRGLNVIFEFTAKYNKKKRRIEYTVGTTFSGRDDEVAKLFDGLKMATETEAGNKEASSTFVSQVEEATGIDKEIMNRAETNFNLLTFAHKIEQSTEETSYSGYPIPKMAKHELIRCNIIVFKHTKGNAIQRNHYKEEFCVFSTIRDVLSIARCKCKVRVYLVNGANGFVFINEKEWKTQLWQLDVRSSDSFTFLLDGVGLVKNKLVEKRDWSGREWMDVPPSMPSPYKADVPRPVCCTSAPSPRNPLAPIGMRRVDRLR